MHSDIDKQNIESPALLLVEVGLFVAAMLSAVALLSLI
jgi:hypothetical protein